jgi:hypothetical protein
MSTKAINAFRKPTGHAPIRNPYVEKVNAPARLIHLNFRIELMVIESAIAIEAR